MSEAWKAHERAVAKYFNTKRRTRGADFSQTDVEVLTSTSEWLGWEDNNTYIIAECKYSKYLGIVSSFRDIVQGLDKGYDVKIPILRLDDNGMGKPVFLCKLEDFEDIFVRFIYHQGAQESLLDISETFSIISKRMSIPNYINNYLEQSRGYTTKLLEQNPIAKTFPIAVMAKASTVGRVVVFSSCDLQKFWDEQET